MNRKDNEGASDTGDPGQSARLRQPKDSLPTVPEKDITRRESAVIDHEVAALSREKLVTAREEAATVREREIRAAETLQAACDNHMSMLQQANTQLVMATIEAHQMAEQLRESKDHLAALINQSICGIAETDLTGRFTMVNDHFCEITGYTHKELVGKMRRQEIMHPDDLPHYITQFRQLVEEGVPFNIDKRYIRKDGSIVWTGNSVSAIADADGRLQSIFAVMVDITEHKRIEREREDLLEREQSLRQQAEDANRAKDEFLALLSHELRTPLAAMLGWATMLKNKLLNEAKTELAIGIIEHNARLQNALIEDLLDVSRIITGKMKIEPVLVDLNSIVEAAVETVRPTAESKQITIEIHLELWRAEIKGDAHRLQQIIGNLLTNAVKFTPEGGSVCVELVKPEFQIVQLIVCDTGCGIEAELLPHVFDRFKQADSSTKRRYGGLGLGLAIVRSLTEMHDGRVWAMSGGENQGSTFTVELPLIEAVEIHNSRSLANVEHGEEMNDSNPLMLAGINVLVVDNYEAILEMLQFVLEQNGAQVTCVSTAQEALLKIKDSPPDILISDIGMAEMDGLDLIKRVRDLSLSTNGKKFIPAIAMTGYASIEDREQFLGAGYQMHVVKPIDVLQLSSIVAKLFEDYNINR